MVKRSNSICQWHLKARLLNNYFSKLQIQSFCDIKKYFQTLGCDINFLFLQYDIVEY